MEGIFNGLVRFTIGSERYDSTVNKKQEFIDRYNKEGISTSELNILNQLLRSPGCRKRTNDLEKEWLKFFQPPEWLFEAVHGDLYEVYLIDSVRVSEGWDEIHYTSLTNAGKELLKDFLGEEVYNLMEEEERIV